MRAQRGLEGWGHWQQGRGAFEWHFQGTAERGDRLEIADEAAESVAEN